MKTKQGCITIKNEFNGIISTIAYWRAKLGKEINVSVFSDEKGKLFHYKGIVTEVSESSIVLNVRDLIIPVSFEEICYFIPADKFKDQEKEGVNQ